MFICFIHICIWNHLGLVFPDEKKNYVFANEDKLHVYIDFSKTQLHVVYFLLRRIYELCKFIHKIIFNSISYDIIRKAIIAFCFVSFYGVLLHFKLKWRCFIS